VAVAVMDGGSAFRLRSRGSNKENVHQWARELLAACRCLDDADIDGSMLPGRCCRTCPNSNLLPVKACPLSSNRFSEIKGPTAITRDWGENNGLELDLGLFVLKPHSPMPKLIKTMRQGLV
jgi:hypothetical protein